ncbi:Armadillo repeat-containing protein LFR [Linum perenne]
MQKRDQKFGSAAGGTGAPPPKRGRPFGSTNSNSSSGGADATAPSTLLGPSLQVHNTFADQNNKRIVLALQSGLKSELRWALNTLTLLSFKEKEDLRKDSLAKIPGLLDALLQVIDDWRDIALPKELSKSTRVRALGANSLVTGFGHEYKTLGSVTTPSNTLGSSTNEASVLKNAAKVRSSEWWSEEDGIFNLDDEGRAERQQCAVAASNIIRNFSFMPENEVVMAQLRHCVETVFQCMEDHNSEDEELVTNALETVVNLAPLLDLRILSSQKPSFINMTEKRAVQAVMAILGSSVKAWQMLQIHKRLVDLLTVQAVDAQAAAVGALYNLAEVNMDCRLKLASERWAVDRLLKVIKMPHPVPEICRKAAMILESLVSEPQNRPLLLIYENSFAEILFSESKYSDTFARILYELTARPNSKFTAARGIWGMY